MKMEVVFWCGVLLGVMNGVLSDVYLHNPRGSNNRLDANSRDVRNDKRLFNSQNNARGGYNMGNMYYYEGTVLPIEWTNQHSCGGPNNNCELVIQYMCGPLVRDGDVERTAPFTGLCKTSDCNHNLETGMQEDYDYHLNCRNRHRNEHLFTADQELEDDSAQHTRQNPEGDRYGYECAEERDYYPYWHPSPWKDIVVMTNDVNRCKYYKEESENVKGRYQCVFADPDVLNKYSWERRSWLEPLPNNREDCENYVFTPRRSKLKFNAKWVKSEPHNIPAPECLPSPYSRDNHNGNGIGGEHNSYNWTIPKTGENDKCVLRIRYNISTDDFAPWETDAHSRGIETNRRDKATHMNFEPNWYGLESEDEALERGYIFKNNPEVQMFADLDMTLALAINTAQFGRTFQDRSHVFTVKPRPDNLQFRNIHNVNVRGKRGNLQQVYPATEYDFVPNTLYVEKGDFVHFQWTGSNSNPGNNAGNGRAGTDRSNIVALASKSDSQNTPTQGNSHWATNYPANLTTSSFLGFSLEDRQHLALLSPGQYGGMMSLLDDSGTYYDLGPKEVTETGVFHYMCTRNNQFTNRNQKARIISSDPMTYK